METVLRCGWSIRTTKVLIVDQNLCYLDTQSVSRVVPFSSSGTNCCNRPTVVTCTCDIRSGHESVTYVITHTSFGQDDHSIVSEREMSRV